MRVLFDAVRSLFYGTCFVLLWGWVALWLRRYDSQIGLQLPPWTGSLAIPLMILGGIIAVWSAGAFVVKGKGTPAPFDAPREFVAAGPYRYVRNPMYIGALTVLLGFGFYMHSLAIVLMPAGVLLLVHSFVVFYEEPHLRDVFGEPYRNYCRSVRRWIPRFAASK